jgi:hypothetical protein
VRPYKNPGAYSDGSIVRKEMKSTTHAGNEDCSVINSFVNDLPDCAAFCASMDPHRKKIGSTICIPYYDAAKELGFE